MSVMRVLLDACECARHHFGEETRCSSLSALNPGKKSWRRGVIKNKTRLLKRLRVMHAGMIRRNKTELSLRDLFELYRKQGGLCGYWAIPMNLRTGSDWMVTVSCHDRPLS